MIKNFEEITDELNDFEKSLIPVLIKCFSKYKESNPIKAPAVVSGVNAWLVNTPSSSGKKSQKFTDTRLRKCVNYIRTNGLLPLISTSKGYFVSYDSKTINDQIVSLNQRASSIARCADGLKVFIEKC